MERRFLIIFGIDSPDEINISANPANANIISKKTNARSSIHENFSK